MQPEPPKDVVELKDPRAIRAIAHPARMAVIDALYDQGKALTATQAAKAAGTSPSAMSYHLRALERFGLVKRSPASDGRERPWIRAATYIAIRLSEPGFSTAAAAATEAVLVTAAEFDQARLAAAIRRLADSDERLPLDFATGLNHTAILVTPGEAREVLRAVQELLEPYRAEVRLDTPDEAGMLHIAITTIADPDRPGAEAPDTERS
jgi:DNA-binding transcriptional ArsR family regulator